MVLGYAAAGARRLPKYLSKKKQFCLPQQHCLTATDAINGITIGNLGFVSVLPVLVDAARLVMSVVAVVVVQITPPKDR